MKLPQLTLRDLFWLVLVCAVAACSWAEHWRQVRACERERKEQLTAAEKQAAATAQLRLEIARTSKAAQWAHDLYRDMSDHLSYPSNEDAIEFAGKYFEKGLRQVEYAEVPVSDSTRPDE